LKKQLKKYGISDKKIAPQDVEKWDKKEQRKKSKADKKKEEIIEEDLDQTNQDPELREENLKEISPNKNENQERKANKKFFKKKGQKN
jgi:hypothetical protein